MKTKFMRYTLTLLSLMLVAYQNLAAESFPDFSTAVVSDSIVSVEDTVYLQISDCNALAELCVDISESELMNYQFVANGMAYNNGVSPCDLDTITRYNYTALFSTGPYVLQSWQINGTPYTLPSFNTIDELVAFMNSVDPDGNWVHDPTNELIIGGVDSNEYSDMVIFVVPISSPYIMGVNQTFEAAGTILRFEAGFTEMIIIDNNLACSDTFYVDVTCLPHDTIILNMFLGDNIVECFDIDDLPGGIESVTNICPGNSGSAANMMLVNGDSCVVVVASNPGTDFGCFVVCDSLGLCDTTTIIANVSIPGGPGTHEYFDTIYNGNSDFLCINTLVLPGTPDTIYNICPGSSNINVSFDIDLMTYCVDYQGSGIGTDTACIVICDEMNVCDTTLMYITSIINSADYYYDTLYLNMTEAFCDFDLSGLPGNLVDMVNGCPGSSGESVDFIVDMASTCVLYNTLDVGKDTACIYLTDDQGISDTTYLVVCVLEPEPETIVDTLRLGLMADFCLDQTQLGGLITDTIYLCEPTVTDAVTINPNDLTLCINLEAVELGTDTFCVYICDEFMVCDTTYFQITVEEEDQAGPPSAVDDTDITSQNNEVVTNVCGNDILPDNNLTAFYVLPISDGGVGPVNGAAFVNDDCTIEYEPDADFCGETDAYTYVICNAAGCDTAVVTITVECPATELTIYDGFSPNGDGINDYFVIDGIEGYPNSELLVYDRWGMRVLQTNNYQNDWDGRWEGVNLPDGVYFYFLNDGEDNEYSGYVMLTR